MSLMLISLLRVKDGHEFSHYPKELYIFFSLTDLRLSRGSTSIGPHVLAFVSEQLRRWSTASAEALVSVT